MTPQEQQTIHAALAILSHHANHAKVQITSWDQLLNYAQLQFATHNHTQEHFHVLYLDRKNCLILDDHQQTGTVDHVPVYPREVIKKALLLDASAMILMHNHPSGDPTPSHQDIDLTKQINKAAKLLNILLHDHLVVCPTTNQTYSLKAHGDF